MEGEITLALCKAVRGAEARVWMLPTNTVSQALSTKEGESLVHFTVCDVKGRCNLIIWGWTKPDTHTRSSVSAHKTITVLFLSSYQQYFHTQDWLTS